MDSHALFSEKSFKAPHREQEKTARVLPSLCEESSFIFRHGEPRGESRREENEGCWRGTFFFSVNISFEECIFLVDEV